MKVKWRKANLKSGGYLYLPATAITSLKCWKTVLLGNLSIIKNGTRKNNSPELELKTQSIQSKTDRTSNKNG